MINTGPSLSASKLEKKVERNNVYETEFQKFEYTTTKGTKINLKREKSPILIINFWASWCRPCLAEFEGMNKLVDMYGTQVKIIGINNDSEDTLKAIEKTEKKYNLRFESIANENGEIAEKFNILSIPATIVYAQGKVITFSNREFNFMDKNFLNKLNTKLKLIKNLKD